jgi:hypothetical protein
MKMEAGNKVGASEKISLAQDRDQSSDLLKGVRKVQGFRRGRKFMTSCTTISLS